MRQRPTRLFAVIFALGGFALLAGASVFFIYSKLPKYGWLQLIFAIMFFAIALWFWMDIRRRK
jgi:hypothetical protein